MGKELLEWYNDRTGNNQSIDRSIELLSSQWWMDGWKGKELLEWQNDRTKTNDRSINRAAQLTVTDRRMDRKRAAKIIERTKDRSINRDRILGWNMTCICQWHSTRKILVYKSITSLTDHILETHNRAKNSAFWSLTAPSYCMIPLHWWLKATYTLCKASPVVFHRRMNVK